jgi:hypothetical protein
MFGYEMDLLNHSSAILSVLRRAGRVTQVLEYLLASVKF